MSRCMFANLVVIPTGKFMKDAAAARIKAGDLAEITLLVRDETQSGIDRGVCSGDIARSAAGFELTADANTSKQALPDADQICTVLRLRSCEEPVRE